MTACLRGRITILSSKAGHCSSLALGRSSTCVRVRRSAPIVSVGLKPLSDGESVKLTIAPLLRERPHSAGETSASVRALLRPGSATPERPAMLRLDADSTPLTSAATSPLLPARVMPAPQQDLCSQVASPAQDCLALYVDGPISPDLAWCAPAQI